MAASEIFDATDYIVFALTLCASALIGIYFGCFGSKQKSATEYLFGKKRMKAIPVGLSLFSSAASAITIVGAPGEIYTFGSQFCMMYVGILLSFVLTWYFILPVFCGDLKISTPYEYFELRFNYKIRIFSTAIYILHAVLFLPVVLYASTISFSEVSQISLPVCTTIIGGVCILYTMLGGFTAVIWSDTLQATLMLSSCILVMIKGILNVGGIGEIFHRVEQGQRLNFFDMDPNPFKRLTFWSTIIGMVFHYGAHSGCGASAIQRYIALKNEKQARISTFIGCFSTFIIGAIISMIGLTMFAQYYDCDPVKNKEVSNYNKLFSYYIVHTVQDIPGFAGFFIAGILSAGLSTISAELNTISGLIYHGFIKKFYKTHINESKGAIIMKILVLLLGIYCLAVCPILEKSEHLIRFALGINGLTYGAKLGIMILGTTFPQCNSIGVGIGSFVGIIITAWISFGALFYSVNTPYVLPVSTENCATTNNFTDIINATTFAPILTDINEIPFIYKLSYMYYVTLGMIITVVIALIISYATGGNDTNKMDPNMFIPWVRPKRKNICASENINMLTTEEKERNL